MKLHSISTANSARLRLEVQTPTDKNQIYDQSGTKCGEDIISLST